MRFFDRILHREDKNTLAYFQKSAIKMLKGYESEVSGVRGKIFRNKDLISDRKNNNKEYISRVNQATSKEQVISVLRIAQQENGRVTEGANIALQAKYGQKTETIANSGGRYDIGLGADIPGKTIEVTTPNKSVGEGRLHRYIGREIKKLQGILDTAQQKAEHAAHKANPNAGPGSYAPPTKGHRK